MLSTALILFRASYERASGIIFRLKGPSLSFQLGNSLPGGTILNMTGGRISLGTSSWTGEGWGSFYPANTKPQDF